MSQKNDQRVDNNRDQGRNPFQVGGINPRGGLGGIGRRPVVKPKNFTGTMKKLWSYIGREKKLLSIVFLIILVDSALTLSAPYLIGRSIDAMSINSGTVNFRLLKISIFTLFIAYITDGILTFIQGWIMAGVSQRVVKILRLSLFEKLQKLPVAYFDNHTNGELMSRLSNDVDNVNNSISQSTTQLFSGFIVIVGSLIMMIILSPILTLATLMIVPLVFLLTQTITKKTSVLFKNQQVFLGRLNGHIEETISGLEIVKAFNHEEKAIADFEVINQELKEVGLKAQIWSGFLMPIMNVINNIGFAVIAIVGGILAVKGSITLGVIASFLSYSRQFVRPLNDLANMANVLQSGVAGAERVFEIMDENEETLDLPGALKTETIQGYVEFDNVSFSYRPDVPILKNISFKTKAGSKIALVGPTGAGKTTIVNLLTRFYDPTEGKILIDGHDIREYSRDCLRRYFGIVLQDTYLFSGTIKDNIKYGKPDATDKEVERAAIMANADVFINRLPQQYDTELSENGGNLSQGQKQLLAIARVILADPSILILDEATSSVDTRTELNIQDALLNIMQGRTSFIIAHRLNTIRHADSIMVIDKGEIVEKGSHRELMNQQGFYYHMVANQLKNIEVAAEG